MKNVLFIALILISFTTKAQIFFKNNTNEPVIVAKAFYYTGSSYKGWGTQGWYKVQPNERIVLSSIMGSNDYFYYYAKGTNSGNEYQGNASFLVSEPNAFDIKNADMQYVKDENPNYTWVKFRKVKLPTIKIKYTIELNY